MFTIIGGDGREYGPVTTAQVREWIMGGRANLETKARRVGTEEWRRLGEFADFAPAGSVVQPPLPPPTTASPGASDYSVPSMDAAATVVEAKLGGIGARTGAAFLNAFLYLLGLVPTSIYATLRMMKEHPEVARFSLTRPEEFAAMQSFAPSYAGLMFSGLFFVIAIQCLFITVKGQNIGKLVTGVRVVNVHNGANPGFVRGVLLRFIVPVIIMYILTQGIIFGVLFLVVDYCFIFREDRRCLHDLMAGTKVVKA